MPIRGERGGQIIPGRIDVGAQVNGRLPRADRVLRVSAGSLRHPDVGAAEPSRAVGADVQAQAVVRDRGMLLVRGRIDDRAEVHRRAPGTIRGLVFAGRLGR